MADWNPSLYLQFGAERTRPAAELLARIAHHPATLAVDLGCGPGNSTALLRDAWPDATIIGVDNSPAMLEEPPGGYRTAGSSRRISLRFAPSGRRTSFMPMLRCSGSRIISAFSHIWSAILRKTAYWRCKCR
jgi:SAM-dependent methyltransferase